MAYIGPVTEGCVEGLPLGVEQISDVGKAGDLKHLRLFLHHLSVQGREETAGGQQHRALGEDGAFVVHPLQVALGDIGHADGPRRTVQELVAVPRRERESEKEQGERECRREI